MYCRHCGVELLDWAKVCVMCGASTDDASPVPVNVAPEESNTTIITGRSGRDKEDTTQIVDRPRNPRVDTSASEPAIDSLDSTAEVGGDEDAHEDVESPQFEDFDATVVGRRRPAPKRVATDAAPSMEKEDHQEDFTGLFVNPEDDVEDFVGDTAAKTKVAGAGMGPLPDSGVGKTGVEWSSMRRERQVPLRPAQQKSKTTRIVAICCAVAGVISLAILAFVLLAPPSKSSTIQAGSNDSELQQTSGIKVAVPLNIPSLDDRGSRIPVHVSGKTESGVEINEDAYISHDGNGLKLEVGTYEVRAAGSPISVDGVIYVVPDKSITITFVDGLVFTQNTSEKLTFTEIAPQDMTLAQINAAYDWAAKDPERGDRAGSLLEAARKRRAEAVAEIEAKAKAEEEARATAEAEAKRREQEEAEAAAAAAAAEEASRATQQEQVVEQPQTNVPENTYENNTSTYEDYGQNDVVDYGGGTYNSGNTSNTETPVNTDTNSESGGESNTGDNTNTGENEGGDNGGTVDSGDTDNTGTGESEGGGGTTDDSSGSGGSDSSGDVSGDGGSESSDGSGGSAEEVVSSDSES